MVRPRMTAAAAAATLFTSAAGNIIARQTGIDVVSDCSVSASTQYVS